MMYFNKTQSFLKFLDFLKKSKNGERMGFEKNDFSISYKNDIVAVWMVERRGNLFFFLTPEGKIWFKAKR